MRATVAKDQSKIALPLEWLSCKASLVPPLAPLGGFPSAPHSLLPQHRISSDVSSAQVDIDATSTAVH